MKFLIRHLLVIFLTFCFGTTFSQTTDSLSIFPNPFKNSTTIHFDIVQPDTISLRVFNRFGETVRTFFQATILPGGSYNVNLLGDSLDDGAYFVRLDIGSNQSIVKYAIKCGSVTGISDNKPDDKVLIFPNPTIDRISIPLAGNKIIIVTDLNGKIVKSLTTDKQVISLSDISAGQYIITILTDQNEIITTQIILKNE
ncbi:MAG: T9SS type A sorting domain-containing protein [Bacteroidia bacterium]